MNLVLSDTEYSIRRSARNNLSYSSYRESSLLPYDVEYSLSKVFERELELVRSTNVLLDDVKNRYDFNVLDVFSTIHTYGLDSISAEE